MSRASAVRAIQQPPERAALADAIAHLRSTERDLQAARDAWDAARSRWAQADTRLEKLQAEETGDDLGERFSASVRAGEPCDVAELERPAVERTAAIEEAKRAVETWQHTMEACKAAIPARANAVDFAKRAVERAARNVIQHAGAVGPLLDGLAELQAALFERRLQLHFLALRELLTPEDKILVEKALADTKLPGGRNEAWRNEWHQRPAFAQWQQAFEALQQNADAPLPIDGAR